MVDPISLAALMGGKLGWATLGANVLGGFFGGAAKAKQFKEELRQRRLDRDLDRYKYDRSQAQSEGNDAYAISRSQDMAPIRDRAAFLMGTRLGQFPGGFHPGDSFNPGSIGGIDRDAIARANAGYQPGEGGTGGSQGVAQAFLNKLGYPRVPSPWSRQNYWKRNPSAGSGMTYA